METRETGAAGARSSTGTRRPALLDDVLRSLILVGVLAGFAGPSPANRGVEEHRVKAELVERFTRFVEWPDEALSGSDGEFVIGIVGGDPFRGALEEVASRRELRGRPMRVLRLGWKDPLGDCCQLLYLADPALDRLGEILERTRGRPILTVADRPGAGERGVLINLYRRDDRIAFEINVSEVDHSGLGVSSKLLRLARLVGRETR